MAVGSSPSLLYHTRTDWLQEVGPVLLWSAEQGRRQLRFLVGCMESEEGVWLEFDLVEVDIELRLWELELEERASRIGGELPKWLMGGEGLLLVGEGVGRRVL